ncbi:MAG: dTDP-4-dehydrorhamnose reductase [Maricaulis sp.]|uniref:dTDP-4-dehydrorhamnose reductase n=1 Tax=Maricaulis sp. TaxID=1486257 RepID=UPI00329990F9
MTQAPRPVLVIGASGQLARAPAGTGGGDDVVTAGRDRFDALTGDAGALFDAVGPRAVINASAWTDVNGAETARDGAMALNCEAVARLGAAAAERELPFFHISTDYVFDGKAPAPLDETATTRPLNVYGESKLAGEQALAEAHPDAVTLRVAWLFDAEGGSFLKAILGRLEQGQPVKVVADQYSAPTWAGDLARDLLKMSHEHPSAHEGTAGVFHYCGGRHVNWADFARAAASLAGDRLPATADITEIASSDWPQPAERPLDTRLDASRLQRVWHIGPGDWQAGLRAVIETRYS